MKAMFNRFMGFMRAAAHRKVEPPGIVLPPAAVYISWGWGFN